MAAYPRYSGKQLDNSNDLYGDNLLVDNTISAESFEQATDGTGNNGALRIKGGASIARDLWVGGVIHGVSFTDAATLLTKTWSSPAPIGDVTPSSGTFTSLSVLGSFSSGTFTSTVGNGVPPFNVSSLTVVPNLNVNYLQGRTWTNAPEMIVFGPISVNDTTQATTLGGGSINTLGGIYVTKDLRVAGTAYVANLVGPIGGGGLTNSAAFTTVNASGAVTLSGVVSITNTTASTSSTTGCLVLSGGLGVDADINITSGKSIFIRDQNHGINFYTTADGPRIFGASGGSLSTRNPGTGVYSDTVTWNATQVKVQSTTNATDATGDTGSISTLGGMSIAKDLYIGGSIYLNGSLSGISGGSFLPTLIGLVQTTDREFYPFGYISKTTPPYTSPAGTSYAIPFYSNRVGYYTIVGKLVTVNFSMSGYYQTPTSYPSEIRLATPLFLDMNALPIPTGPVAIGELGKFLSFCNSASPLANSQPYYLEFPDYNTTTLGPDYAYPPGRFAGFYQNYSGSAKKLFANANNENRDFTLTATLTYIAL